MVKAIIGFPQIMVQAFVRKNNPILGSRIHQTLWNTKGFEHEDIINLNEVLWRNNNQNQQNKIYIFDRNTIRN